MFSLCAHGLGDHYVRPATAKSGPSGQHREILWFNFLAGQPDDIEQRLRKHLPEGRIELIREGLKLPTFRMDITKKSDGKHWAENPFDEPPRLLETSEDIEWAFVKQAASLLVEVVMFVMSIAGIVVFVNRSVILRTVEEVSGAVRTSSRFKRAVREFVSAWKDAGGSKWARAKAIFILIKDTNSAGILWTTIKSLSKNMSRLDWLKASAKVTATIIAALATEGVALIAKIALTVMSAYEIAKKVENLRELDDLRERR